MNVFDSSAILAYVFNETGADAVRVGLEEGGLCGAANWSEVAQKVLANGGDVAITRTVLETFGVTVTTVGQDDAEAAARMWRTVPSLSLADRLCLALAERVDGVAWTADTAWPETTRVRQIR